MNARLITKRTLAMCVFTALIAAAATFAAAVAPQNPQQQPKISDGERKALEKINTAADFNAKMQAAGEFVKKFDKSSQRPRVASYMAAEVAKIQDNQQRLQAAQSFTKVFNQPDEVDQVQLMVIETQIQMNKYDDAFSSASQYLTRHPDNVALRTQLAIIGADQAQRQEGKFVQASQQYGAQAIEMMETDKKPEGVETEAWNEYRAQWLPRLYQSQGVLSYVTNNRPAAKELFEKSAGLNDQDPVTLMMIGTIADDEYQDLAKKFNAETAGPGKDALLKQAYTKLDEVIDWYARSVAASDGKADYAPMQQQLMQNLEAYYSARHGSGDGLKALIDKYKKK
ncbi:MAG: hypothetical protein KF868_04685 [Acidobacteria bacterium]|nr:hypothetical protein [Acidobacteriota bacterium]